MPVHDYLTTENIVTYSNPEDPIVRIAADDLVVIEHDIHHRLPLVLAAMYTTQLNNLTGMLALSDEFDDYQYILSMSQPLSVAAMQHTTSLNLDQCFEQIFCNFRDAATLASMHQALTIPVVVEAEV